MPSATSTLSLAVGATQSGGTANTFNLIQKQQTDKPVVWSKVIAASGSMIGQETIGYSVKNRQQGPNPVIEVRVPTVAVDTTTGMDIVKYTQTVSIDTRLDKRASLAERTRTIDLAIAALYALRSGLIAGEAYF